jgi:hypothetical protein
MFHFMNCWHSKNLKKLTVIGLWHLPYPICFRSLSLGSSRLFFHFYACRRRVEVRSQGASDFKTLQVSNSSSWHAGPISSWFVWTISPLALTLNGNDILFHPDSRSVLVEAKTNLMFVKFALRDDFFFSLYFFCWTVGCGSRPASGELDTYPNSLNLIWLKNKNNSEIAIKTNKQPSSKNK